MKKQEVWVLFSNPSFKSHNKYNVGFILLIIFLFQMHIAQVYASQVASGLPWNSSKAEFLTILDLTN